MKKEIKEKFIKEINLKEIEAIDRDETLLTYKILAAFGIGVLFFYNQGFFVPKYFLVSFVAVTFICFFIFWFSQQTFKYISDCYSGLRKFIKNERILEYKIPRMNFLDVFYYKREFSD